MSPSHAADVRLQEEGALLFWKQDYHPLAPASIVPPGEWGTSNNSERSTRKGRERRCGAGRETQGQRDARRGGQVPEPRGGTLTE